MQLLVRAKEDGVVYFRICGIEQTTASRDLGALQKNQDDPLFCPEAKYGKSTLAYRNAFAKYRNDVLAFSEAEANEEALNCYQSAVATGRVGEKQCSDGDVQAMKNQLEHLKEKLAEFKKQIEGKTEPDPTTY